MLRGVIHAGSCSVAERTDAERIKGMQALSDALDAQRKQTGDTWIAATASMRRAWEADRNDRRVILGKHEPERRRR
jgi:hypothetical protein